MDYFIVICFALLGLSLVALGVVALRKPSLFDNASSAMFSGLADDRATALRYLGYVFIGGGLLFALAGIAMLLAVR